LASAFDNNHSQQNVKHVSKLGYCHHDRTHGSYGCASVS
jgi:hypothetical protein